VKPQELPPPREIADTRAPKPLRVLAWVLLVLNGWALLDIALGAHDRYIALNLVSSFAGVAGAIALLRRRRWGYAVLLAESAFGVALVIWHFRHVFGVAALLTVGIAAIPVFILLLPSSRAWVAGSSLRPPLQP
jgi:hypothetical protein